MKPSKWIPASKIPPLGFSLAIVKGGNYAISEAIYMREGALMTSGDRTPPGFFILLGGGHLCLAPWVEWWIPMPVEP